MSETTRLFSAFAVIHPKEASVDWVIIFDDVDRIPEFFTDEVFARERLKELHTSWNCYLFCRAGMLEQLRAERDKLKALLTRCLSALDGEALADRNFHKPLSKCGAWLALRKDIEAEINPIQR